MRDELFASHIPVLTKIIDLSEGPILELGLGFSTMIIDMMCRSSKRPVVSYENDLEWYKKNFKYASGFHKILFANDWDKIDIDSTHWSVVLIDHRPGLRRKVEVERLKDNADYLILHDSEPEKNKYYLYTDIYPLFKYRYDYTKCMPFTTVLSNLKEINI